MNFEVGDKVRVRKWKDLLDEFGLKYGDSPEPSNLNIYKGFNESMQSLCGTVVTIQSIENDYYRLKESFYMWTDDMLEDLTSKDIKTGCAVSLDDAPSNKPFSIAGIKMCKLHKEGHGWLCVYAESVFEDAYETGQNYAKSTIHRRLIEEVLPVLVEKIGDENLLEFTLDLQHHSDRNKFLDIRTKIGIPTYKMHCEYNSMRRFSGVRKNKAVYATAYSSDDVLCNDGTGVNYCSIRHIRNVVPIVCLADSLEVIYE